jgi:hypothetical protein
MSENRIEVYRQFRASQDKYCYFLLAAAAAAIAFAVQRTEGMGLNLPMIPLGIAVLAWSLSFFAGCRHLAWHGAALYANMGLLSLQAGDHPNDPGHPELRQAAADGIRDAVEGHSSKAVSWARTQFSSLIFGAICFLCWHVLLMAARTV